jgi:hypothetical protein
MIMRLIFACISVVFSHISFANNSVLDFDSLSHIDDDYIYHSRIHIEDGYILDANNNLGFASWGSLSQHYTGSSSLINDAGSGLTTLRRLDNQSFDLHSIDLGGLLIWLPLDGIKVTFTGTKADNSLITQTFTGSIPVSTYFFNDFNNLSKVEWLQDNDTLGLHQYDNIVLSAVPETSTVLLFSIGLIGIAALRRRKFIY